MPALVTSGLAPRNCAAMPWKAVKKISVPPIHAADAHTACGANGAGLLLENAHMVNAGAAWMPISANM